MTDEAMTPDIDPEDTRIEYFKLFRAYRLAEHELLSNRITWNLTIQGFLFAAYGLSVQKAVEVFSVQCGNSPTTESFTESMKQLNFLDGWVIPVVGFLLSVFVFFAVLGAELSLRSIGKEWNTLRVKREWTYDKHDRSTYVLNPISGGSHPARFLGTLPPIFIPVVFGCAWLTIWSYNHLWHP